MGIGAILSGAGAVLGALKGGKSGGGSIAPFDQWPKEVKDAWLKEVVGKAPAATTQREFRPIPMARIEAGKEGDPFRNIKAEKWQSYSDSVGGLFSPLVPGASKETAKSDGFSQSALDEAMARMFLMSSPTADNPQAMQLKRMLGGVQQTPDILSALGAILRLGSKGMSGYGAREDNQDYWETIGKARGMQ